MTGPLILAADAVAPLGAATLQQLNSTAVLKDSGTGAAQLPAGTTAQRPGSPSFGETRANSTLNQLEWWDGTTWTPSGVVQTTGFKNRIINGDCRIAQRGNVAAALNTWKYGGADRIRAGLFGYGSASGTINRASGVGIPAGYGQSISGVTTTGTGQVYFSTLIESLNTYDLSGKTITVSVNAYQDSGSSINAIIQLFKPPTADNFTSGNTLLASETVSVPSGGSSTQLALTTTLGATDAENGLGVYVYFPTGAITSKTFTTWGWQLEEGVTVTPIERRPLSLELLLCQRYYYKTYYLNSAPGSIAGGNLLSSVQATCNYFSFWHTLPATMFSNPTITAYNPVTGAAGSASFDGVAKSVILVGYVNGVSIRVNNSSVTVNQFGSVHFTAEIEIS
jgi:hypothetical protein